MAFNHLLSDPANPTKTNGVSPSSQPESKPKPTPLTQPTGPRTPAIDRIGSPPPAEADSPFSPPHYAATPDTPNGDSSPVWSSAVGRATTGKSGRVIERLMNENDRLLREKKLATVKLEEEVKRGESARLALESLELSNANLTSMHESDEALLIKRDRKLQELKEELRLETARREKAERDFRDSRRERDETVEKTRREAFEDREVSRRATSQYDVLSKSWKNLEERYEKQVSQLRTTINALHTELQHDRGKVARLEVIIEQLRREEEKTRRAKDKLITEFDAYRTQSEHSLERIRDTARDNESANDEIQRQLVTVLGEMRHVIGVQKAFERSK